MSDSSRKMFPIETVMALVAGKDGIDIKEIAGYVTGCSIVCDDQAKVAGLFAAAWLARWYPNFTGMIWSENQTWPAFVSQAKSQLGENVSLNPMDARTKEMAKQALDYMADAAKSVAAQTEATMKLEERVRELEPYQAQAQALQKKVDELEAKVKTLNADMGGLRRKVAEFDGKVPLDQDEFMSTVKDAIKNGLKGVVVGGVAAGAAAAGAEGAADAAPAEAAEEDFGFGFGSSDADEGGFGF
ncbi:MAG: hypothetical protein IJT59_02070 [Desulfovibrionaceae bacterium]|nr:hypothetical protein [Desulfovibrionaceae bacterium]